MANLITTFIEVVTSGDTSLADAIRDMNAALGTKYIHSRLREWERGDRHPSSEVVNYMMGIVMPWLLEREGISDAVANRLVKQCLLP